MLRQATTADEIAIKCIAGSTGHDYAENLAEYDRTDVTVAECGGVVAGYMWASIRTGNCQIFICVAQDYRRRGIGTALFREAERKCREKGEAMLYSSQYYDAEVGRAFAESVGCDFTSGSTYMINQGESGICYDVGDGGQLIQEYNDADAAGVHQIVARAFYALKLRLGYPEYLCVLDDELNQDRFDEYSTLAKDGAYVLVEPASGEIAAYGCIDGNKIGSLAVAGDKGNMGYGKALARFMTKEIFARGNKTAELWCEYGNDNARYIYHNLGYREVVTGFTSFKKLA